VTGDGAQAVSPRLADIKSSGCAQKTLAFRMEPVWSGLKKQQKSDYQPVSLEGNYSSGAISLRMRFVVCVK
jgi:hypothetical protein